jgi:hypothetical protein
MGRGMETGRCNHASSGLCICCLSVVAETVLLVYAVHLKSNRGEIHEDMRIREESMRQLISHIRAMKAIYGKIGTLTWLVGGDFNTSP